MIKQQIGKIIREGVEYLTIDSLVKAVQSETGKKIGKKLVAKPFNIGSDDEGIFRNAKNELSNNSKTRAQRSKEIDQFVKEMKKKEYSFEWFKKVLASQNKDHPVDSKKRSPAAETLLSILHGKDFDEKVEFAGDEMMHKTIKSNLKDGWHFVFDKTGKVKLLVDRSKIPSIIIDAKDEFIDGLKTPVISSKKSAWTYIIIVGVFCAIGFVICFFA